MTKRAAAGAAVAILLSGFGSVSSAQAMDKCRGRTEANLTQVTRDDGTTGEVSRSVQEEAGRLNADLAGAPGFGGLFILADGSVCVARLPGPDGDMVARRVDRGSDRMRRAVSFTEVAHSRAELDDAVDAVTEQLDDVEREEGVRINVAYADVLRNRAQVGIQPFDVDRVERLRRRFAGVPITFYNAPPPRFLSRDDQFPLEGGIAVRRIDAAAGLIYVCSAAFAAQRPGGVFGPAKNFLIFAGHCTDSVNETWEWRAGGMIGYVGAGDTQFSGQTDGAVITTFTDARNTIYISDTTKRRVRDVQMANEDAAGQGICMSARTNGAVCGTIFDANTTLNFEGGPTITNTRVASFRADPGDSGGSVYQRIEPGEASAAGVVSAQLTYGDGTVRMGYTHIEFITRDLGVQVQTTDN